MRRILCKRLHEAPVFIEMTELLDMLVIELIQFSLQSTEALIRAVMDLFINHLAEQITDLDGRTDLGLKTFRHICITKLACRREIHELAIVDKEAVLIVFLDSLLLLWFWKSLHIGLIELANFLDGISDFIADRCYRFMIICCEIINDIPDGGIFDIKISQDITTMFNKIVVLQVFEIFRVSVESVFR